MTYINARNIDKTVSKSVFIPETVYINLLAELRWHKLNCLDYDSFSAIVSKRLKELKTIPPFKSSKENKVEVCISLPHSIYDSIWNEVYERREAGNNSISFSKIFISRIIQTNPFVWPD